MQNYGKKFEAKFKGDWLKMPQSLCMRLLDVMSGYKQIKNPADFVCYKFPFLFLLDCKSLSGNTFNFAKLTQWEDMEKPIGVPGANIGAVIWFMEWEKVCFVPIEEFIRLKGLGYKSIHVNMIGDANFNVYEIPGKVKRFFIDSDYSVMLDIAEHDIYDLVKEKKDEWINKLLSIQ